MKVGFDADGVIYRFTKAYHLWMNQSKGMSLDPEVEAQTWDWFEDWETVPEFLESMDKATDAGFLFWQGDLCEETIPQNLHDLREAGHTIHVVTHRFSGKVSCVQEATRSWFAKKGLIYDTLDFSGDKTSVKTDLFIEDNLKNYDALDAAGVKSYLVNRPYNLQNDYRRRVNSVNEFTNLILGAK
jgi:FMN phosphatase YigB (HAD superfamily)